jgi:putative ABC transport system ATP-binding protein
MASLLIKQDQQILRNIQLSRTDYKIGSASECEVRLQHPGVSSTHARITWGDGLYYLEDLESGDDILLNGEKVQRAQLQDGDTITVYSFQLEFVADKEIAIESDAAIVEIRSVNKEYYLGKQIVTALCDISLNIHTGEFMALAGPSGSGKSTLLNLIGCIDTPTSGSILIDGRNISGKTPDELADLRLNTLGFVFQTFNLLPVLSAWENVEYPLLQQHDVDKKIRQERVQHYLKVVGLESYAHHRPNELSGGQRQRVAIARALATRPSIILADEPTANLDHKTGEGILRLMKDINQNEGTTFVFSTHDARVMEMAGRVIELADGRLVV